MEADLARHYQIDYRDRWAGGRLTLRRIAVLLRHLPPDSAVLRALGATWAAWTRAEHLLDEVRRQLRVMAGDAKPEPWPGRFPDPSARPVTPERRKQLDAARRRARERRRRIAAGEIT